MELRWHSIILASALLLFSGGCVSKSSGPEKTLAQQYDFNPQSVSLAELPSGNDPMLWARYGPAQAEQAIREWLQDKGVSFPSSAFISIDWASARSLRIGTPYHKYSIVVVNTEKNLRLADKVICEQMKGQLVNARFDVKEAYASGVFDAPPQ